MEVDLSGEVLFDGITLSLDKKITFVLGKNGTGKSTLANILSKETDCYDVSVFNGFNNIIEDNKRLNAVVLGEENAAINKEIEDIQAIIAKTVDEKNQILKSVSKPDDDKANNFWTRYEGAKKEYDQIKTQIEGFYTNAARSIKRKMSITSTYNKNNFVNDIDNAQMLNNEEKKQCEDILKSEIKNAPNIFFPNYDLKNILNKVNGLLTKKVAEKTRIARLENQEKRAFAEHGLKVHKKGDICAFCGSKINDNIFIELEKYFSADEVIFFQKELNQMIEDIDDNINSLEECAVNIESFYPQFQSKAKEIK